MVRSSCCSTAVASSWMFICRLPSPLKQTTRLPGQVRAAPMAAGRPKPMVPSPPEVSNCPGRLNG